MENEQYNQLHCFILTFAISADLHMGRRFSSEGIARGKLSFYVESLYSCFEIKALVTPVALLTISTLVIKSPLHFRLKALLLILQYMILPNSSPFVLQETLNPTETLYQNNLVACWHLPLELLELFVLHFHEQLCSRQVFYEVSLLSI